MAFSGLLFGLGSVLLTIIGVLMVGIAPIVWGASDKTLNARARHRAMSVLYSGLLPLGAGAVGWCVLGFDIAGRSARQTLDSVIIFELILVLGATIVFLVTRNGKFTGKKKSITQDEVLDDII